MPYFDFVTSAANNEKVFRSFKRAAPYQAVVTCPGRYAEQEACVVEYAPKSFSNSRKEAFSTVIPGAVKDDFRIGHPLPEREPYNIPGLRPLKLQGYLMHILHDALDLELVFGSMDNFDIYEVGGGYGMLANVLARRHKLASYTTIDLPAVCKIVERVANEVPALKGLLHTISSDSQHTTKKSSLFVSNYAYTEVDRDVQDQYFEAYIRFAKRGFIQLNFMDQTSKRMSTDELFRKIQAVHATATLVDCKDRCFNPSTFTKHISGIIVWGVEAPMAKVMQPMGLTGKH